MNRIVAALLVAPMMLVACRNEFDPENIGNAGTNNGTNVGMNNIPNLGKIGEACESDPECNPGLVCDTEGSIGDANTCQAPGDVAEGQPCFRTAECSDGLYCEPIGGVCLPAGEAELGGSCGATGDCVSGLVCAPAGFSGQCIQPGENDFGAECSGYFDCIAGLGCVPNPLAPDAPPTCQAGAAGLPLPWPGVECAEDEMDGNFRIFFELPDAETTEFYRLPYPNDIRSQGGHPVLDGHPTPGDGILGFDIVERYKNAIESQQDRFGLNSWTFMRFSEQANFESITTGGDNPAIYTVVLSPNHPRFGDRVSMRWQANTQRNKYICQNWLAVRPGGDWGRPMDPNTTYGVIVTTAVRSDGGVPASQDEDFATMLAASDPGGDASAAWTAYAPLRSWIADAGIDASTIAVAAVFTTGDPLTSAQSLAAPARAAVPTASDLTLCDASATSPCDDGLEGDEHERGCFGTGAGFHEIHGKFSLPIFQQGEAPYLESGGNVTSTITRREDVCFGMTVPDAQMPAEGWPVIVYGHGTGGSFRSHVGDGTVELVNSISVDGQTVQFLTIGWDQVQHGLRRNGNETHPNELVFNYANPDAAMGNFLQGAADTHAVLAYVEALNIDAASSPTGQEIRANPEQIYFLGHSQGGTTGPLALPWDPTAKGAVLSGAGAGLALAILGKTTPVNSPQAVAAVLAECGLMGCPELTTAHPVINLLQAFFDPVDPVNFGHLIASEVEAGVTFPHHVFHTNGLNDTYSPNPGLDAMARSLNATYLLPFAGDAIDGVPTASAPFGGNIVHDMVSYSVLGRQYAPGDYDGHFVLFRNTQTQSDVASFLGTAITLGVPEVR